MSSLVWISTTTSNSSRITVVDANNPGDVLETFHVTTSHILCIASVPGKFEKKICGLQLLPKNYMTNLRCFS